MDRIPLHVLLYGDPGSGKSTFAATFPKPMLLLSFDPFGKEVPYLLKGDVKTIDSDHLGTERRSVVSRKTGAEVIRIEHYHDYDLTRPEAYSRFMARMALLPQEFDQWRTVVLDSITFVELSARKWDEYVLNPNSKDARQWFGASTNMIEELLMGQFATMPMNVVVCTHIDEDRDEMFGTMIRSPKMPGKRLRKNVAAAFGELYRMHVAGAGNARQYLVQTQADNMWIAATRIGAPDPSPPMYSALWATAEGPQLAA